MKRLVTIICIGLSMGGCVQQAATRARPSLLADADVYYDTQVSMGQCTEVVQIAPLLLALAGSVITQGVNRIGTALRTAASESKAQVLARRNIELAAGGLGQCIVVTRGWFYRNPNQAGPMAPAGPGDLSFLSNDQLGPLHQMGLFPAAVPDFYFEGVLIPNSSGTSYTIVPLQAGISRPLLANTLRSDGRHVAINFALVKGGAEDISGGAGSTITLGELPAGQMTRFGSQFCQIATIRDTTVNGATVRTLAETEAVDECPTLQNRNAATRRIIRSPGGSEWFSVELSESVQPMTLLANVTEVNNASAFLTFVADVFKDNQQAIADEIRNQVLPPTNAQLSQRDTARTNYDRELVEVEVAVRGCVDAPSESAKRLAARLAVREFLAAARAAEMPVNESMADMIPLRSNALGQCQSVLTMLPPG